VKSAKFKDSPLGPIPQDWEVKRLGEIGEPLMCKRVLKHQTSDQGDIPFYKIGTFGKTPDAYITRSLFESLRSKYPFPCKGDCLISAAGTIGRVVVYNGEDAYFQDSNIVWIDNDEAVVTNEYLALCYALMKWQSEDGGIISRLYNANLKAQIIVCPPLPEQQRIAESLGEVDKLIESFDEQIEKKRLIAKGVAHDLLSGAKRLPGFKGEWKSVRLGELSEIVTGGTPSTEVPAFWGGDIRWMNSGDVHLKRIHDVDGRITQLGYASSNARLIPIGSVVIALAGQGKTRGTAAITECELCTNQSIGAILPSEKHDSECLYYVLAMQYEKLRAASSGDGTRGGLSKKILEEYIVKLPVDIAEQQAIADLLGEQDAAIAALEAKREKYARIKEGMMRDLLTGKVRMKGEREHE